MNCIRKLNICIPSRDRIILTSKCIESIWKNSNVFNKINIYVFDNKSDITTERLQLFYNMLSSNRIQYYSYDTDVSTLRCFGKAIVFNRWLDMMKMEREITDSIYDLHKDKTKDYYMLLDNDFILGPRWGEYFVTVCDEIHKYESNIKFIVKWPGGIPGRAQNGPEWKISNNFEPSEYFTIKTANSGGASGLWFGTYDMFKCLRWELQDLTKVFAISKRHDTETWNLIRRKYGMINYVVGLISPDDNNPLILHLGNQTGSLCNLLKRRTYDENKDTIKLAEEKFSNMSVDEIFEQYKKVSNRW